jgi:ribonucleoside-diphosphate reductase beta chain
MILDPGFNLTLRPMAYPAFYEQYRNAIMNTWTVEEVDLFSDITDLNQRLTPAERHLISRLVAFFATGDSIVSNNLVPQSLQAHQFSGSTHVSFAAA